jgi:hypothetical protein
MRLLGGGGAVTTGMAGSWYCSKEVSGRHGLLAGAKPQDMQCVAHTMWRLPAAWWGGGGRGMRKPMMAKCQVSSPRTCSEWGRRTV